LERSFAHLYETGRMRRVYLRGHTNIRKRLLTHTGGFNLGLLMRQLIGVGTPRGLQGRVDVILVCLVMLIRSRRASVTRRWSARRLCHDLDVAPIANVATVHIGMRETAFTTGC
jgi:transposase